MSALTDLINAYIRRNANQEITGPILNGVLLALAASAENVPYIGANGDWYLYDTETGQYADSGHSSTLFRDVAVDITEDGGAPSGSAVVSGTTLLLTLANIRGEQGPQGPQGPTGPAGVTGASASIGYGTVPAVALTFINGQLDFMFSGIQGAPGLPGPQGPEGPAGTPGITAASVSVDGTTGTPSVDASITGTTLNLAFHNLKGEQGIQGIQGPTGATGATGPTGAAAGFGTPTISVGANQGTPSASVTASGPDTAKVFAFAFDGLKGETGPQGPQGPQGNPGSSVNYPFTLANNLTTDDSTVALTAAQGVVLQGEVDQLEQKLIENASVPMAYELPSKMYINASGSILVSTTANVCLFPVVPGKEYRVVVPKSGNTATKTIAFGQYIAQTTGLTVGAYTGNSARLEATVTVPAGMRYMFFTFIKSEGDVTVHTDIGIDEVVAEQGEEIVSLDETLLEKRYMTFPGTVTIEDGYRFDTDGTKVSAAGYKIYTVSAVGYDHAEIQKLVFGSSAKVSCVTYDASSNIVEIYPVADTVDLDLTGVSTVSFVSYNGNPVFVPYSYYKFTDLILPAETRIEGKFWNCSAIGQTAVLAVIVTFNSIDKYPVTVGESYMLYGKGGTSSSRLWALLDADGKAIDIASSGETATLEVPKLYTVTNPAAAFLILSSEVGYDYGIIPNTPVGNEYRDKMLTDNFVGQQKNTIVLAGASFAYPNNRWFGKLIERYGGAGFNYAVSGSTIATLAQALHDGAFFTDVAFDDVDVLMIMYTHNNDVADQTGILDDYTQYTFPASGLTPAQCWDYVLKKYTADCLARKDDSTSKWYNYPMGKPCNIVVLTHWHDARTIFNNSIRTLRDRWGFHLVELDKNIGFSKNEVNPTDGNQISRLYAQDTETIDGVVYGWHPLRSGNGSDVIQSLIARIVFDELTRLF